MPSIYRTQNDSKLFINYHISHYSQSHISHARKVHLSCAISRSLSLSPWRTQEITHKKSRLQQFMNDTGKCCLFSFWAPPIKCNKRQLALIACSLLIYASSLLWLFIYLLRFMCELHCRFGDIDPSVVFLLFGPMLTRSWLPDWFRFKKIVVRNIIFIFWFIITERARFGCISFYYRLLDLSRLSESQHCLLWWKWWLHRLYCTDKGVE